METVCDNSGRWACQFMFLKTNILQIEIFLLNFHPINQFFLTKYYKNSNTILQFYNFVKLMVMLNFRKIVEFAKIFKLINNTKPISLQSFANHFSWRNFSQSACMLTNHILKDLITCEFFAEISEL